MLRLTAEDQLNVDRELCKRSLTDFVKMSWPILEPAMPYVHGKVLDAIAEHLVAVTEGQITRLLINVPPGMMKSLLVGVFWPMWEWGPRGMQANRYVGASHSQGFALRDNQRARRLVFSEWYQERWSVPLAPDQDTKTKFENLATGWRCAMAAESMTGERGDRLLVDDPHSVEGAISDAQREATLRWFAETLPTRMNDPKKSVIVVIMQRLHQGDVSGHILEEELGYEHLMLPMEYEKARSCITCIGFKDWRTEEDELLFPERFPREVVERDKKVLKTAAAGQFQQRPAPRGGAMIPVAKFKFIKTAPTELFSINRYWDKAGTEAGGKRTAGVKMARDREGRIYILHVVKGQWAAPERESVIKNTAIMDGRRCHVWVEQEPGSGGKESAEATIRNLSGFTVRAERPTGDKAFRAEPFASAVDGGNVYIVEGEWNQDYVGECELFPFGRFADQVDASSGAYNKVTAAGFARVTSIG